jgi:hypothetical protein
VEIDIPDGVVFYSEKQERDWISQPTLCFRHAVLRAITGESIKVELKSDRTDFNRCCDDCEGV